jgi:hypothetical protein
MNGAIRAEAKGHPTMPPIPNHIIPAAVLEPPCQSIKDARPNMDVYIAKLDGSKETDAWIIPGLNASIMRKSMPSRGFKVREMTLNSFASHAAQRVASARRMK